MLALGIVLIVLAVVFGLGVSVSSGDSTNMSVFGVDIGLTVPTLFLLGAATGIALVVGLWLTKMGLGRGYRRHKEVRELRQQVAAAPTATEPASSPTATEDAPEVEDSSRTVDPDEADQPADEPHTVAEGTESKEQRA
jgi:hypothetical protein